MVERPTSRISPTAHYTGYVWCRHGLAPPELATLQGKLMFHGLQPLVRVGALATGGVSLETFLLQRHRIINHLLEDAITDGRIGQVVEIAGGLTGRGCRLAARFAREGLIYVEGDLPDMARRKRQLLDRAGLGSPRHHVIPIDVLADGGPLALSVATDGLLDPRRGTALITEGLLTYFALDDVLCMWRSFADLLSGFPAGLYLSDVHLADQANTGAMARLFLQGLRLFAARRIHLHFDRSEPLLEAARQSGLAQPTLHEPARFAAELDLPRGRGPDFVRVLGAWLP